MTESFGQRFLRLRKAKGLTQDDIAKKVNISAQAVSKWENDISSPDISILTDLAEILGVRVEELLGKEVKIPEVVEHKDLNKLIFRINVLSKDGDKIKVNLPLALVKAFTQSGMDSFNMNGKEIKIDFKEILSLAEQGVIGTLVEVDSADGDHITITVE
jgi:transcriptional regulator with XRE-family HTH domain